MKVLFLEIAEQEFYDSQEYYEEQQTNLGNKFKNEVYNSLKRIQKFPNMFVKIKKDIRKCIINKFPFNILYSIEGDYILGMVGRITEGKGYHIAIKAFLGLNLENAKLVIVGSANKTNEKSYLESLKKIVEKNGAEDRVIFVPHQNNVSVFYKIMNIYLNPVIIDEGFGLSVAEAMAAGVAVISSPYGGLSEFVKSNETAEVVMAKESDAVESLKELILKLKNNEILAKTLSKNARELIESRFNFSQTYIALTDVYQFLDSLD